MQARTTISNRRVSLRDPLWKVDYKLLVVLVLTGLIPTIYLTVCINFLGALPANWRYNIASQLTWLNVFTRCYRRRCCCRRCTWAVATSVVGQRFGWLPATGSCPSRFSLA